MILNGDYFSDESPALEITLLLSVLGALHIDDVQEG